MKEKDIECKKLTGELVYWYLYINKSKMGLAQSLYFLVCIF